MTTTPRRAASMSRCGVAWPPVRMPWAAMQAASSGRVSGPASATASRTIATARSAPRRDALRTQAPAAVREAVGAVSASSHGWSSRWTRCSVPRFSHATTSSSSPSMAAGVRSLRARRARAAARRPGPGRRAGGAPARPGAAARAGAGAGSPSGRGSGRSIRGQPAPASGTSSWGHGRPRAPPSRRAVATCAKRAAAEGQGRRRSRRPRRSGPGRRCPRRPGRSRRAARARSAQAPPRQAATPSIRWRSRSGGQVLGADDEVLGGAAATLGRGQQPRRRAARDLGLRPATRAGRRAARARSSSPRAQPPAGGEGDHGARPAARRQLERQEPAGRVADEVRGGEARLVQRALDLRR